MKLAVRSEDEAVSDAIHEIVASGQVVNCFFFATNPASIPSFFLLFFVVLREIGLEAEMGAET